MSLDGLRTLSEAAPLVRLLRVRLSAARLHDGVRLARTEPRAPARLRIDRYRSPQDVVGFPRGTYVAVRASDGVAGRRVRAGHKAPMISRRATTNARGAEYPRVDGKGRVQIRFKQAPEKKAAAKVRVAFLETARKPTWRKRVAGRVLDAHDAAARRHQLHYYTVAIRN